MIEIEHEVIEYLRGLVGYDWCGVELSPQFERGHGYSALVVRRTGGGLLDDHRDQANVGVQCYADGEEGAADLAMRVRERMKRFAYRDGVAKATLLSMRSDPDLVSMCPRWFLNYQIICY